MAIGLETQVRGLRETLIELRNLDKTLYTQLNSDIKNSALPFAKSIENALPKTAPLSDASGKSGFVHNGATAFKVSENKTSVKTSTKKPRGNEKVSLLKVIVKGRGLAIADMAGRKKTTGRSSGRSKPSSRRPTGYRLNGQGTALIRNLNKVHKASRFVWPAALKNQNLIDNSIERSLQEASAKVNRNLLVVK
jgi:hypothetical protein